MLNNNKNSHDNNDDNNNRNNYSCGNMTIFFNTDFLGFDIGFAGGVTWATCCGLCLANACYLKTTPTYNGTYITTHMSARY